MGGLFEKYSFSQPSFSDAFLQPIQIKMSVKQALIKIEELFKKMNFQNIRVEHDFQEIFAQSSGIDYTISLAQEDSKTIISIATYCENKKGRSRKALRQLTTDFRKEFQQYIY